MKCSHVPSKKYQPEREVSSMPFSDETRKSDDVHWYVDVGVTVEDGDAVVDDDNVDPKIQTII